MIRALRSALTGAVIDYFRWLPWWAYPAIAVVGLLFGLLFYQKEHRYARQLQRPTVAPAALPHAVQYAYSEDLVKWTQNKVRNDPEFTWFVGEYKPVRFQVSGAKKDTAELFSFLVTTAAVLIVGMPFCIWMMSRSSEASLGGPSSWPAGRARIALSCILLMALLWFFARGNWILECVGGILGAYLYWRSSERAEQSNGRFGGMIYLCVLQSALGIALAGLFVFICWNYDSKYPRLAADAELFKGQSIAGVVHQAAYDVGPPMCALADRVHALTPLNHFSSWNDLKNPFAWLYFLGRVYLFVAVFVLIACVLHPEKERVAPPHRLASIAVSYFAVGFVFAILYYSLYIGEIAKHNAFMFWLFNQQILGTTGKQQELLKENDRRARTLEYISPTPEQTAAWERLKADLDFDPEMVVGLIRARQQNSVVFAQEKPQLVPDTGMLKIDPAAFEGTFVFESGSDRFEPGKGPAASGVDQPANGKLLEDFEAFLDRVKRLEKPDVRAYYHVRLLGAADKDDGDQFGGNENLSRRRARAVRERLTECLLLHFPQDNRAPPHIQLLRAGIESPELLDISIQPPDDPDSDMAEVKLKRLWPSAPALPHDEKERRSMWRATNLKITLTIPGAGGADVRLGLGENVSFEDMLYFSFVAFTTTGYGDIRPVSTEARFFVILQNVLEVVFASMLFTYAVERARGKKANRLPPTPWPL